MPKKSTGYTPTGKRKSNPTEKMTVPAKTPSLKPTTLPTPIKGGSNAVASMPGNRFPKLTKPIALAPRTPKI